MRSKVFHIGIAVIIVFQGIYSFAQNSTPDPDQVVKQLFSNDRIASEGSKEYIIKTKSLVIAQKLGDYLIQGEESAEKETALYLLSLYQFQDVKNIYLHVLENTKSFRVKKEIITLLGNTRDKVYVGPIAKELESEFSVVRDISIKILTDIGDDRVFPVIFKMAERKESIYKVYALNALYYLYDFRLLSVVQNLLQDENKSIRILAIQCSLKNNIEKTIPIIKNIALNDQNVEVRIEAIQALSKMGNAGNVSVYLKTISSESKEIRNATAEALLRNKYKQALYAVSEQLSVETDNSIKNILLEILLEMKDGGGFRGLEREILNEEYAPLRIKAAYTLGIIGGQKSLGILFKAISDSDFKVRAEACNSLGIYNKDKNVSSGLIGIIRGDRERYVRLAALFTLERLRDKSAVIPLLDQYSVEKDPVFRAKLYEVTRVLIQASM